MRPLRILILILVLHGIGACAKSSAPVSSSGSARLYSVTAVSTAFYVHGPRQGSPDEHLPRDTQVRLIRYSPSFDKVALMNGLEGYVLTDDLGSVRHPLPIATESSVTTASTGAAGVTETPASVPESPLPEFEPTPLPGQTDTN